MSKRLVLALVLLPALACDRGPSGGHGRSEQLGGEVPNVAPPTGPRDVITGGGAMPPGHPSTGAPGAMPPGHPAAQGGEPGAATATPASDSYDPAHPSVAGITFAVPPPFSFRRPEQTMRLAEYVVPERAGETAATMTVHHFPGMGGSIESNVDRWVNQFTQPDGRPSRQAARVTNRTVNGVEITVVDVTGTFGAAAGMPGQPFEPLANQRLLGAIVNAPEGPVFFKLTGDARVVARAETAFDSLLGSIAPGH
ncbi:MAG: hypothetical protein U0230_08055 [Polyangiales bacterium]